MTNFTRYFVIRDFFSRFEALSKKQITPEGKARADGKSAVPPKAG
jgi:hypothetical protein